MLYRILLPALIIITNFTMAQWHWQNPYPTGNPLRSVQCVSETKTIMVGDYTEIIETNDNGNTWISHSTNVIRYQKFNDISMINNETGYIVGNFNKILKTNDGGETWNELEINIDIELNSVFFINDTVGFTCGNKTTSPYKGRIYKTTNAGNSWTLYEVDNNYFSDIYFYSDSLGFIASSFGIFKTTDQGATWISKTFSGTEAVYFSTQHEGYATSYNGKIFKSSNGGENWQEIYQLNTGTGYNSINSVFFIDTNVGCAVGMNTILRTTDAGQSWSKVFITAGTEFFDISFINNVGYAVSSGFIYKTTNYGQSWTQLTRYFPLGGQDMFFLKNGIGCILSYNSIWRTSNNGETWTSQLSVNGTKAICLIENNYGYAIGTNGLLLKSTDTGLTWESITLALNNDLNEINFPDFSTGFIVGNAGLILKTTDGGENWTEKVSGVTENFYSVFFLNSNIGFVGGANGIILKTVDGGITWTQKNLDGPWNVKKLQIFDDGKGYAICTDTNGWYYGCVYRTTDGGENWECRAMGTEISSMQFINTDEGYVGRGSAGIVYKTTDGGDNWFDHSIKGNVQVNGLFSNLNGRIWASAGGILLYEDYNIIQGAINVFEPNGGENWQVGLTHDITWSFTNINNVKIEFTTDNGASWLTIIASTPSDGSYSWTIPNTPSTQCKVKIIDVDNASISDESDGVFTIAEPFLILTEPNGGENLQIGTEKTIRWISNFVDNVRIEYTTNNGADWTIIESSTISDGAYEWTVRDTKSLQCKVKITDVTNALLTDESDDVFKITYIPVIVIPGIMGSALFNDVNDDNHLFRNPIDNQNDEFIWADDKQISNRLIDWDHSFMEVLDLADDGITPASPDYNIKVPPLKNDPLTTVGDLKSIFPTSKYDKLLDSLEGNNYILDNIDFDHTGGEDLYFFTYDWRKSCSYNYQYLNDFIDSVLYRWNHSEQVNLVCHSMGGLVAKKYIQVFGKTKVKKLIFIATPHLGAPKILYVMLSGDLDWGLGKDIFFYNNRIRQMARNMPSTYELMPSENYFNLNLDNGVSNNANRYAYCFNSPQFGNSSYNEILLFFSSVVLPGNFTYNLNLNINADSFRDAISNVDLEGVEVYNIVGYDKPTIGFVEYKDRRLFPVNKDLNLNGDGTVPLKSAEIVNLQKTLADYYVKNEEHSELPSSGAGTFLVKNLLKVPAVLPPDSPSVFHRYPPDKYAAKNLSQLIVGSPVELHAYDLVGNHTGPTSDSTWEESIQGSEYFPGDLRDPHSTKSIIIPNETEFRVEIISQDTSASFNFRYNEIVEGNSEIELLFDSVLTQENTIATMSVYDTTNFFVFEMDYDGDGITDTTISPSITNFCVEDLIESNWNMISIPYLMDQKLKENLYPTAISDAYWFNGGYIVKDTLEVRRGYWLKFPSSFSNTTCGQLVEDTIHIKAGWNMVGGFNDNTPVTSITTDPPGIITNSFWGYNGGYSLADTLEMGKGYWIKADNAGIINLNQSLYKTIETIPTIDTKWASITIIDALEKEMILYLSEEADKEKFILPPLPPEGAYDIRFSSNLMVESIKDEARVIDISGAVFPIKIKVRGIDLTITDLISGNLLNEAIRDGNELMIYDSRIDKIIIDGNYVNEIPINFSLEQNYPNPFNPNTTISFAIPKEAEVNLSIFNILGEKVKELKNEVLKPGYYEVEFNASTLASGIYFYRIKADDFVDSKKMILLK